MSSKNGPPTSSTRSAPSSALRICRRVARQRRAKIRMRGRERARGAAIPRTRPAAPIVSASATSAPCAPRSRHVVADDDAGVARLQKQRRQRLDARRIGRAARHNLSGGDGLDRGLLLQHVDRQRDEHRPLRRVGGDLERAAQDRRDLVGALDLHAPLGDAARPSPRDRGRAPDRAAACACPAGRRSRPAGEFALSAL